MDDVLREYLIAGENAGLRYMIGTPRGTLRGLIGDKLGSKRGSSLEFMDHREYMAGDDLRRIDWNAFARSDKLSVKLYRDEVSPHVDIVIDSSLSMTLVESAKTQAMLGLAGLFARAAVNCGYTFGAWTVGDECRKVINGGDRPGLWEGISLDSSSNCSAAFKRGMPMWKPRGIRVLLSDLLWLGDPHETLCYMADGASSVFVVQVLGKGDVEPPGHGNVKLHDSESGEVKEIYIDSVVQERYKQNLARHQYNWNRGCKQSGAIMSTVVAEDVVENWQLDELVKREILKVQ